jgi:hypothetical protein
MFDDVLGKIWLTGLAHQQSTRQWSQMEPVVSTTNSFGKILHPKGQILWLVACSKLNSNKENLLKKHCVDFDLCELCNTQVESAAHLIARCPFVAGFWNHIGVVLAEDDVASLW